MVTRRDFMRNSVLAIGSARRAAPAGRKNVMVTVFLRGGADGLNIVPPHGDPEYHRLRPTIAVRSPIDLDGYFGLHPALAPLVPLWKAKHLAIVHAVGSGDRTGRHFEAERAVWEGCRAKRFGTLGEVSRRMKSGEELESAVVEVDGWDHHANESARLAPLLAGLGQELAAFWRDLGDRMEHVTVATVSEFGRSARENAFGGTDHGGGAPMFVLGGSVEGGRFHGTWPGLRPEGTAVTSRYRDALARTLAAGVESCRGRGTAQDRLLD